MKRSFVRKVIYLTAMAVLLLPLYYLSSPRTAATEAGAGSRGGHLAALRDEYRLGQANLGEIDPSSETMQLATLGLRGVAAVFLWEKAHTYKKHENWTELRAVLDQIRRLQPNFVSVWRFQGWNLSFNVSAEWDDYRDRYYWVVEGIRYLDDGTRFNDRDTRLFWDEAWYTGYKIGRSDEYLQFRDLFREPNALPFPEPWKPVEPKDNWLYGRMGFLEAQSIVRDDVRVRGTNEVLFYSEPAKCSMRFAAAMEEEGRFGEYAEQIWRNALNEWDEFGNHPLPLAENEFYRIYDLKQLDAQLNGENGALARLDALDPGRRKKLEEQRRARLTEEERRILDQPDESRTPDIMDHLMDIQDRVFVTHTDVANAVEPASKRDEARKLAAECNQLENRISRIHSSKSIINYDYWRTRCVFEASPEGVEARELLFKAHEAYRKDIFTALEPYRQAFAKWDELLALPEYQELIGDGDLGDDLITEARRYNRVLQSHDLKYSENMPWKNLKKMLDSRSPSPPIGE